MDGEFVQRNRGQRMRHLKVIDMGVHYGNIILSVAQVNLRALTEGLSRVDTRATHNGIFMVSKPLMEGKT